jgi:hypothetical protein
LRINKGFMILMSSNKRRLFYRIVCFLLIQLIILTTVNISSPIYSSIDIPFFSQHNQQWTNEHVGTSGQTIGQMGCAMTCTAMILKYYGVDVNPGTLNAWLSSHNGYTPDGSIYWGVATNYSPGKVTWIDNVGQPTWSFSTPTSNDWSLLDSELSQGYPVIVQVNDSSHWVIVTYREGSKYYINDPEDYQQDQSKTLASLPSGNTFQGMRFFHGTQNTVNVTDIPYPDAYSSSQPGFINFEGFPDGTNLSSGTISGVQFTTTNGYTWFVSDISTNNYNGKYPQGSYMCHGTHNAWLGPSQGSGRIDFPKGPASYFSLLVSNLTPVFLEGYDASDNLLATAGPSSANVDTGHMSELKITRATKDMAYVIVHDEGNFFIIDDVCTNAPETPNTIKRVVDQTYPMQTGSNISGNFILDLVSGARQLIHVFIGPFFSNVDVNLTKPDGTVVSPNDQDVTYVKTANSIEVFIDNAPAGQWRFEIIANQLEQEGEDIHITVDQEMISALFLLKNGIPDFTVVAPDDQANTGDKINYAFTVTNSGSETLLNVTVSDPNIEIFGGPIDILAPGVSDSTTFTGSYVLTQSDIRAGRVDNIAKVQGFQSDGEQIISTGSNTIILPVKTSTITVLTSSTNPSTLSQSVTFTAAVNPIPDGGTIQFQDNSTNLDAPVALDNTGKASYTTSSLSLGSHNIFAVYNGDDNFTASVSDNLTQTINQAPTDIDLTSSDNPSTSGQSITFTATVSTEEQVEEIPSGSVTFTIDNEIQLPAIDLASSGPAPFTTSILSVGLHSMTAEYSGDDNFTASVSDLLSQTVDQASTKLNLTSSANPSTSGRSVTFTATVSAVPPATGIPTGSVTFKDGTSVIGTDNLSSSGQALFTTSSLSAGSHTINAVYSADDNFTASTGTLIQTVSKSGGGGGGGGGGSSYNSVYLNGLSAVPVLQVDSKGVVKSASQLKTLDGKVILDIASGARLLTSDNSAVSVLNAGVLDSPPKPPDGNSIVLAYAFSPDGAKFDPAITLTITCGKLPDGVSEKDLYLAYSDGVEWRELETLVDPLTKTVTAKVAHFSSFALIGKVSLTPTPATPTPVATPTLTTAPAPSTTVQATTATTSTTALTPSIDKPLTTMPSTETPAATDTLANITSSISSFFKQLVIPWGMIVGILVGLIVVIFIIAFIRNRKDNK